MPFPHAKSENKSARFILILKPGKKAVWKCAREVRLQSVDEETEVPHEQQHEELACNWPLAVVQLAIGEVQRGRRSAQFSYWPGPHFIDPPAGSGSEAARSP